MTHIIVQENTEVVDFFITRIIIQENTEAVDCLYNLKNIVQENTEAVDFHYDTYYCTGEQ